MQKIVIALQGGLGNQMFQYAAGKAAALRTGADLMVDLTWLRRWRNKLDTPRDYELNCFPALEDIPVADFIQCRQLGLIDHFDASLSGKLNRRLLRAIRRWVPRKSFIREPRSCRYQELSQRTLHGDVYLDGYWQSESYFTDFANRICNDFTFSAMTDSRNLELLDKISRSSSSVSLHVRRGDYIHNTKTLAYHGGICTMEYYRQAIQKTKDRLGEPLFVVFSDDPHWVRKNFILSVNTVYVDWNSGDNSFRDMQLMSSCDHHIIANSSFSWWGAWLGRNPGNIVIAPRRWFNDCSLDSSGVVPRQWLTI